MPETKRAKAQAAAQFEFFLTVVDRGHAHLGGPVVDVQIDSHHPKLGSACIMVGQSLPVPMAEALAAAFTRPLLTAFYRDERPTGPPAAEGGAP